MFRKDFILELQILGGPEGCLDAVGNVDLLKDSVKMGFYRVKTYAKPVGNFVICFPYGNQGKYLDLSLAEVFYAAFCRVVLSGTLKNAFGHHISGKPQFTINDGSHPFHENIQWVILIKKTMYSIKRLELQ